MNYRGLMFNADGELVFLREEQHLVSQFSIRKARIKSFYTDQPQGLEHLICYLTREGELHCQRHFGAEFREEVLLTHCTDFLICSCTWKCDSRIALEVVAEIIPGVKYQLLTLPVMEGKILRFEIPLPKIQQLLVMNMTHLYYRTETGIGKFNILILSSEEEMLNMVSCAPGSYRGHRDSATVEYYLDKNNELHLRRRKNEKEWQWLNVDISVEKIISTANGGVYLLLRGKVYVLPVWMTSNKTVTESDLQVIEMPEPIMDIISTAGLTSGTDPEYYFLAQGKMGWYGLQYRGITKISTNLQDNFRGERKVPAIKSARK